MAVCGPPQWNKSQLEEIYSSLFLINIKSFLPEGEMKRSLDLVFLLACIKVSAPMQDSHTQEIKKKRMHEMQQLSLKILSLSMFEKPKSKNLS